MCQIFRDRQTNFKAVSILKTFKEMPILAELSKLEFPAFQALEPAECGKTLFQLSTKGNFECCAWHRLIYTEYRTISYHVQHSYTCMTKKGIISNSFRVITFCNFIVADHIAIEVSGTFSFISFKQGQLQRR